ncbi:MAG: ABC transporter permease [Eubacteriales bacterium]|nr:ABC transporter permease [Eubacteriales bacterium]
MKNYIIKRLLISILVLFFVGLIIYALMRSLPASYIETVARERAAAGTGISYTEWLDQLRSLYNFDMNPLQGYVEWLKTALSGDFGLSWMYGVPVVEKFQSVIGYSIILNIIVMVIYLAIAIPLGIKAAVNQYSKTDYTITVVALVGISLPTFFIATLLKYLLSYKLGWFELYGIVSRNHPYMTPVQQFFDIAWHFVLPILTLVFISVGGTMRFTRTTMLEVLNSDYIRTARAKGLSEKVVINKHAFRNTLIPLITSVGGVLPGMFSGAMITETLFQLPGIGYISYQAMIRGDIPFTMFYTIFLASLILLGNLVSDILYAVADPRIRVAS